MGRVVAGYTPPTISANVDACAGVGPAPPDPSCLRMTNARGARWWAQHWFDARDDGWVCRGLSGGLVELGLATGAAPLPGAQRSKSRVGEWRARWDSNPRPQPPQGCALSAELRAREWEPATAPRLCLMVPKGGFEPPRPYGHCALNAARLPFRHFGAVASGMNLLATSSLSCRRQGSQETALGQDISDTAFRRARRDGSG